MRYIVLFATKTREGISTTTETFHSKELAEEAKAKFMKFLKDTDWLGGYCQSFPDNLFSVASLYVDLLKNDPITDPEILLKRAEQAFELVYGPKIKTEVLGT